MSKENKTKPLKQRAVRRSYLEEVFPICIGKDGYTINLAGMQKHSPTGDNWGYTPFQKTYKHRMKQRRFVKNYGKLLSVGLIITPNSGNMKRLPYKTFQNMMQFYGNCFILIVIAS